MSAAPNAPKPDAPNPDASEPEAREPDSAAETPPSVSPPPARRVGGWVLGGLLVATLLGGVMFYDHRQDVARDSAVAAAQRRLDDAVQRLDQVSRDAARDAAKLSEAERALGQERDAGARAAHRVTELEAERVARETVRAEAERRAADLAQALTQRDAELTAQKNAVRDSEQRVSAAEERYLLTQAEIARRDIRVAELAAQLELRPIILWPTSAIPAPGPAPAEKPASTPLAPETPVEAKPSAPSIDDKPAAPAADADADAQPPAPAPVKPPEAAPPAPSAAARLAVLNDQLRAALAARPEAALQDGKLILSSDALFRPGSADLTVAGKTVLDLVAKALRETKIAGDWVLRVDGHTDRMPIRTAAYPSNWELSAARAAAAVRRLIESGAPPKRVIAAGFSDLRPLAPGDAPDALKHNRRLELTLIERP